MNEDKYTPKTFDELVFTDELTKQKLQGYVDGDKRRWLLLYGAPGGAKSLTASIIAKAMCERDNTSMFYAKDTVVINAADWETETSERIVKFFMAGSPTVVVNELDHLHSSHQAKLRSLWDKYNRYGNIIFTMNSHPNDVGVLDALVDRCEVIHLERPSLEDMFPKIRSMFESEGLSYSDENIKALMRLKQKVAYDKDGSLSETRRLSWRDALTIVEDEKSYCRRNKL